LILPVHGTRVSVLPLINFSFLKITIFWKKTVFWSQSETRISRFMAVSILRMVPLSAPLGWPLTITSPSQEGGEAQRRAGLRRSPVISGSQLRLPQGFQLLLRSSQNGCTLFNLFEVLFFLKTHPDVFARCSLLSGAWCLVTVEKAGSDWERIGAQFSRSQVWSVLTQYCTYLAHVIKIQSWRLARSSQLGDLAAKLPLFLNTFLFKLADFPNLLPLLHLISNDREW